MTDTPLHPPAECGADRLQRLYRDTNSQVRITGLSERTAADLYGRYLDFVAAAAGPPGELLDVGCGSGWTTALFADRGYSATGIDLNPAAFEPPPRPRLTLVPGSGTALPFADGRFDVVAAYQTLEHVDRPEAMLREMLRVTRPGGVACVVGPNLLGVGPALTTLAKWVWRNRPARRILVRGPGMARHPFGNTLPEAAGALARNLFGIAVKSVRRSPGFWMREPDLEPPFHADNDACYLCNPLDLVRYFRRAGCTVLRSSALGRPTWVRTLAGGTWVAARKPAPA